MYFQKYAAAGERTIRLREKLAKSEPALAELQRLQAESGKIKLFGRVVSDF